MKNTKCIILSILSLLMITTTVLAQSSKSTFEVRGGLNYSDVNYGADIFDQYLPIADYEISYGTGDADLGTYIGLGYGYGLTDRIQLIANLDYVRLGYSLEGGVENRNANVNRPLDTNVPIGFDGRVNYSFLSVETGVRFSFNNDMQEGLFVSAYTSEMIYLNTSWNIETTYEDQRVNTEKDLSPFDNADYNNLWLLGANVGYNIHFREEWTITPIIDFKYGLNSLVEDALEPTVLSAGINLKRWFGVKTKEEGRPVF